MKIVSEKELRSFDFWSGAKETAIELRGHELDSIESQLEELYPDGIDDVELNDMFWFDRDTIATMLGYDDWEDLEAHHEERWS